MKKIILSLVLIVGFTVTYFTADQDMSIDDPLVAYRKGHYRYIVEYFDKNPNKLTNLELKYIYASSQLELKNYEKALSNFNDISYRELFQSKYKHLFPFYVRKVLQVINNLEDGIDLEDKKKEDILAMIEMVPSNSPIRRFMDHELFGALWQGNSYSTILVLDKNVSPLGKAWRELAKSKLNQPYDVNIVIDNQQSFSKNPVYKHLLNTIDPKNYRAKDKLTNLVEMNLRIADYREKAMEFATQYRNIYKDNEYYTKVLAQKYLLDKNRTKANDTLYQYLLKNQNSSLEFYSYVYNFLVKYKAFDYADKISEIAYDKYQQRFYRDVKNAISFRKNSKDLLNWYEKNYTTIPEDQQMQVLRALIRTDIKRAEKAAEIGLTHNLNNPSFILIYALLKEHSGQRYEAYKYYLRLIFQEAFGYAGIVAKNKEKAMRNEFREHFDLVVKDIVSKIPTLGLNDRIMLQKSFMVDDELMKFVNKSMLQKDQNQFNKEFYKNLNTIPSVPALDSYPVGLKNFAPETLDYVENSVSELMKNDKDTHNIARYYFKYRDKLIGSDLEGYLTFRMYFYIRDNYGYTYLPNVPKEILEIVFPKPEFALIKKWSDNDENLAYWMLSSFMAESHFRKRVYSSVGAVGFAQVMPYTAVDIRRWMKKPYLSNYDFYDNLRMGVFYHKRMYDLMDDNVLLSLAAYNAGPGAVNRWKKQFDYIKDDYLFVEAIEYDETRNYVKTITYNNGVYHLLNDYNLY